MRTLSAAFDAPSFWHDVDHGDARALLLDYDGTLAPFQAVRSKAVPYEGIRPLLHGIAADCRTRLVIVSGRPVRELLPLLGLDPPPEIWGCHGWEHLRPDGSLVRARPSPPAAKGLAEAADRLAVMNIEAHGERKPGALALHWRGLPPHEIGRLRRRCLDAWHPLAARYGLRLMPFDGGLELRAPGRDKGWVVREVLSGWLKSCCGKAERRDGMVLAAACLGDDLTDEDAFRALHRAASSFGITAAAVLVRPSLRPTAADLWLRPPDELRGFLGRWF